MLVVVRVVVEVSGDLVVQGVVSAIVQRDEGEVALLDVHGECARVAGADHSCLRARAARARSRRQDDVPGA